MAVDSVYVDPEAAETKVSAPVSRVAERVTVNLSSRSADALESAAGLTGDSKTEVINKALQLYSMVRVAQDDGGGAWIQDDRESDPVRARFY